ncbi:hypothetical protein K0T92_18280 [Paenibacillus oenotherae]|uniref:Uncharacterized protein n=1 Tax=Paenibacillus oenotherae TaxID=1435645 RepID=A0ABS7D9Y0_9BACL|nr:hypothetical protein [Paenibacillus oenotherae]MBW7476670.1 hypothetical protein [Paenibacillus oenotherae]
MNKELRMLVEDDDLRQQLLVIAARHIKLALEHSNRRTTMERKQFIIREIAILRADRDALINGVICSREINKF